MGSSGKVGRGAPHTILLVGSKQLWLALFCFFAPQAGDRGWEGSLSCHYPFSAGVSTISRLHQPPSNLPTQIMTKAHTTLPPTLLLLAWAHPFCCLLPDNASTSLGGKAEKFPWQTSSINTTLISSEAQQTDRYRLSSTEMILSSVITRTKAGLCDSRQIFSWRSCVSAYAAMKHAFRERGENTSYIQPPASVAPVEPESSNAVSWLIIYAGRHTLFLTESAHTQTK